MVFMSCRIIFVCSSGVFCSLGSVVTIPRNFAMFSGRFAAYCSLFVGVVMLFCVT